MDKKTYDHSLCWIRRDLRLDDHVALSEATQTSKNVSVVFVFDTTILSRLSDKDDRRIAFIHESLKELDLALQKLGSALIVLKGDPQKEIPKLAQQLKAEAVFTNRDYEPYAKLRDASVQQTLKKHGIDFHSFKDQVIFEGLEIATIKQEPYRVFTPYKNTWLSVLTESAYRNRVVKTNFTPKATIAFHIQDWDLKSLGFVATNLWLEPGASAANRLLKKFITQIDHYETTRNFPAVKTGTSGLSVHLRFGTVSIRSLVRAAVARKTQGARTWLSELIWRDFYQMVLDQFPYVAEGAFQKKYDQIEWPGKNEHFEAWKEGQTGYPIVDAAMRHFNETGWMHNRLRMVVASFLVKDLLINWQWGEEWFARKLLDFDLAANNGGWQWCASTGCDAQPYFRIFNPITQSKKFDPKGAFIKAHVSELKNVPDEEVHWPQSSLLKNFYPDPIVDHGVQRLKALQLFDRLKI